jgi:hypothetical protein
MLNFYNGELLQVGIVELFNSCYNAGGYLSDLVTI